MKKRIVNYLYIIVNLFSLLLYNTVNSSGYILLITVFFLFVLGSYLRDGSYSFYFSINLILIYMLPLSYINVLGRINSPLFFTWYNIFLILYLIYLLITAPYKDLFDIIIKSIYLKKISLTIVLSLAVTSILLVTVLSENLLSAVSQSYYLLVCLLILLLTLINSSLGSRMILDTDELIKLKETYLNAALLTGSLVLFQFALYNILDIQIGHLEIFQGFKGNRNAFGYIFGDYSFLSLYLSSSVYLAMHTRANNKKLYYSAILLGSSIITSARTGVLSFLLVLMIFFIREIYLNKSIEKKMKIIIFSVFAVSVIFSVVLIASIRDFDILNDTGRFDINKLALNLFKKNPLSGVGFGVKEYKGMLPHNLIFQMLAQGGLILTIPILLTFTLFFKLSNELIHHKELFYTFATIIVGSMFIPDIMDSRYLISIMIMIILMFLKENHHSL